MDWLAENDGLSITLSADADAVGCRGKSNR
jgi:hypothetical protein